MQRQAAPTPLEVLTANSSDGPDDEGASARFYLAVLAGGEAGLF
jgi:hypothetical protein